MCREETASPALLPLSTRGAAPASSERRDAPLGSKRLTISSRSRPSSMQTRLCVPPATTTPINPKSTASTAPWKRAGQDRSFAAHLPAIPAPTGSLTTECPTGPGCACKTTAADASARSRPRPLEEARRARSEAGERTLGAPGRVGRCGPLASGRRAVVGRWRLRRCAVRGWRRGGGMQGFLSALAAVSCGLPPKLWRVGQSVLACS